MQRLTPIASATGVLVFVLAVTARAARADVHVVPPGQENLVGDLLGRGAPMGGCRLVDVDMQPTAVEGTYACEGREAPVVVTLRYPSPDHRGAFTTTRFVVSARGEAPAELLGQLRRTITEHEAGWRWELQEAPAVPSPSTQPRGTEDGRAGWHEGLPWLPPAASCAAMLLVVAADLARRRRLGGRPRQEVSG